MDLFLLVFSDSFYLVILEGESSVFFRGFLLVVMILLEVEFMES